MMITLHKMQLLLNLFTTSAASPPASSSSMNESGTRRQTVYECKDLLTLADRAHIEAIKLHNKHVSFPLNSIHFSAIVSFQLIAIIK